MADPPLVGLDPAFDGVLRRDPRDPTRCEYFQDRNKRWPFHCDDDGFELLSRLLVAATPVVAATQAKIEAAHGPGADNIVAEGQQIYAKKPNMGQEDVTWSQREYGHLGLQKEYLRYKSVQRLTEAWACLQRARNSGVFASLTEGPGMEDGDRQTLRWASLGGGPGFELLAVRWFFERHYPAYDLDLVSLDLEGSLAAVRGRSRSAIQRWDVNDGDGLEDAAGGHVDFSLVSYVLKMYMANTGCAKWLGDKLNAPTRPMRAALVVSRDENLEAACQLMRDVGKVTVVPLMDPSGGRDDRQIAYVPAGTAPSSIAQKSGSPFQTCRTRSTRRNARSTVRVIGEAAAAEVAAAVDGTGAAAAAGRWRRWRRWRRRRALEQSGRRRRRRRWRMDPGGQESGRRRKQGRRR